ncbi:MAG: polysaccharide pyruvyl transferase family protein [Lachnospiraceae bacterium]|jgi:hypothetical protein|nr:polysaccharide pyruvyl transferase family protein [Lachnospiraceae bacterium]
MKKIGIVTLYGNYNIGNKLQNYAVERIYRNLNLESYTIYYALNELEATGASKQQLKIFLKEIMVKLGIRNKRIDKYILDKKRIEKIAEFSNRFLNLAEQISFNKIPIDLKKQYHFFSVGSDQVWRNWTDTVDEMRYFLLSFSDPEQRICIAPSIGRIEIPGKYENLFKSELKQFSLLSCREDSGSKLIQELTGRQVVTLSDPTMALMQKEWLDISVKPDFELPDKFIMVYLLGNENMNIIREISKISRETGLPIINIYDKDNYPQYYAVGPCEFIYLVKRARLICTNSFHGCVFSILFNINFICYERQDYRANMTDRVVTLLNKFHLNNRFSSTIEDSNIFLTDFREANRILEVERNKLYAYVKQAVQEE